MVKQKDRLDAALFGLFLVASFALLAGLFSQASAQYNGPRRFAIATGPTPTPRPTTMAFSGTSGCGNPTRYFGQSTLCDATVTNVDVTVNSPGLTVTAIVCSQPTDATCGITFNVNKNGTDDGTNCVASGTSNCSPTDVNPDLVFATGDLIAIRVRDTGANCTNTIAASCTVSVTIP